MIPLPVLTGKDFLEGGSSSGKACQAEISRRASLRRGLVLVVPPVGFPFTLVDSIRADTKSNPFRELVSSIRGVLL